MYYDIIGDIHGCNLSLQAILDKLGYTRHDNVCRQRAPAYPGALVGPGGHDLPGRLPGAGERPYPYP